MKPIRTYGVTVEGYSEVCYSGRTPAKARWRAYQDYSEHYQCSFSEFLAKSAIRRTEHPAGIGERILVCGKPATTVLGSMPNGKYFMYDDSDVILTAHYSEIEPMPAAA